MKKKTSIEWLYNKMYEHRGNITIEEFEQCKQMHKQEIIEAYNEGVKDGIEYYIDSEWGDDTKHIRGDEFYKNTYEKE